jgi:hypothetical protein
MKLLKTVFSAIIASFAFPLILALIFRFPAIKLGYVGPFGQYAFIQSTVFEQLFYIRLIYMTWIAFGLMGYLVAVALLAALFHAVGVKYLLSRRIKLFLTLLAGFIPVFIVSIYDIVASN